MKSLEYEIIFYCLLWVLYRGMDIWLLIYYLSETKSIWDYKVPLCIVLPTAEDKKIEQTQWPVFSLRNSRTEKIGQAFVLLIKNLVFIRGFRNLSNLQLVVWVSKNVQIHCSWLAIPVHTCSVGHDPECLFLKRVCSKEKWQGKAVQQNPVRR